MGMNGMNSTAYPRDFIKLKSPSGTEDVHYSLMYKGLPEEYRLLARNELNETEENKKNGIKKLREFMQKEKLPPCTDYDLIFVLRGSKYNMKKAEGKLRKFLKLRQKTKQLLADLDETKTELILEDVMFTFLPYRDKHGRIILASRPNLRFDLYQMADIEPLFFASMFYMFSFPLTTVCGLSYLMEVKSDDMYVYYPIIKGCRPFINALLDFPLRYGRVDGMNEVRVITWFYAALRPVLPEKLKKRIFFHGQTYEGVKKFYHPDILPEDFEGNLGPFTNKHFKEGLLNFIEKLKSEDQVTEHTAI